MAIDLSTLSPEDLAAIVAHAQAQQSAEREAKKAEREKARGFLARFVSVLSKGADGVPGETTFKSGAVGWSLGGKDIDVQLTDGAVRKARVSILVRWEDTIPADDKASE